MAGKGAAVAAGTAGIILVWSGVQNRSILSVTRDLISGKKPSPGPKTAMASVDSSSAGSAPSQVTEPVDTSESAWISALLSSIGAPQTQANVSSISSWIAHEGPYGTQGTNNPLNTTYQMAGSTSFDGLAVQDYPSSQEGIQATVATLESGPYNDILMLLRSGQGLQGRTLQGLSTWSGGGYSSV